MKNTLRKITITLTILLCLFCFYCSYKMFVHNHRINDCGMIVSKFNGTKHSGKYSSLDFYLNVNFEKVGFTSIEVSPTLYHKYKKGDRICLSVPNKLNKISPHIEALGLLGGIIMIVLIIISIAIFFTWVFDINFEL